MELALTNNDALKRASDLEIELDNLNIQLTSTKQELAQSKEEIEKLKEINMELLNKLNLKPEDLAQSEELKEAKNKITTLEQEKLELEDKLNQMKELVIEALAEKDEIIAQQKTRIEELEKMPVKSNSTDFLEDLQLTKELEVTKHFLV